MKKENLIIGMLIISILLAAFCVYGIFGGSARIVQRDTINVTGSASTVAKPDVAYITLGVATTDKTVQSALSKNNGAVSKVTAAIKSLGVKDEDIQTSNFWVNPQYDYNKQPAEQTGYTAENDITVKTSPEKISQVILAGASNGANNFYNFTFKVSNEDEIKATLLSKAIDNAKANAEALAKATGKTLGSYKIISYDYVPLTQTYSANYYGAGGMGAAGEAPPINSGMNEVSVKVYITFEVK
ncbi:MAG: SIMPL domain-containing protein [Caldisericaceae bacterium]